MLSDISTSLTNQLHYSTSEIACGTWTNGKTIYRKTILNHNNGTYAHGISNIDEIIKYEVFGVDGNNVYSIPYYHDDGRLWASFYVNKTDFTLSRIGLGDSYAKITIFYTKTTD